MCRDSVATPHSQQGNYDCDAEAQPFTWRLCGEPFARPSGLVHLEPSGAINRDPMKVAEAKVSCQDRNFLVQLIK